ncbi:membrane-spanning 4-domains subfamily A member 8-like [Rhincodon typus]|uniref:membrane-spanning 4-domains subfamily A member 8-like n=1 Tax=Rhincodon typus TaxID=259920 RepID=UPI0020301B8F|nr:membrane-spanning 4-domains subfamily A member 8-like [Rhincodon typus]
MEILSLREQTIVVKRTDLLKNVENGLALNQLPPSQPLPNGSQLVQFVDNGQLNQITTTVHAQNNSRVQQMLKGKLKALGITEIVTGIIVIIIGIVPFSIAPRQFLSVIFSLIVGIPWWTGALFIVAGSFAIVVEKMPTHCMIRGCLAMNIISAIFCLPATIIYVLNLTIISISYSGSTACIVILLLLTLLNAAISVAISSFNCKAMTCCCKTPAVVIIVVYSNASAQPIPPPQFQESPPPYSVMVTENVYAG